MAFTRESEMIAPLTKSLPALLVPEGPYAMACEVPHGSRIVDIMCASMPQFKLNIAGAEPFAEALSRLSIAQTMVLALIWRDGRISTSRLSAMTYMQPDKIQSNYLKQFERAGLIIREHRSWVVGPWGSAAPAQIVAIEAKLTNWREALEQAVDNRTRADLSYIALPKVDSRHNSSKLRQSARERGVGVIELDPRGHAEIVLKAKRAPASICRQKWQLSVRLVAEALRQDGRWIVFDQVSA